MRQLRNPFYVGLMIVGVLFTLTMCCYFVMTMTLARADHAPPVPGGMIDLLARHGLLIVMVELAVLAALTVLAIATDEYWTGGDDPPDRESPAAGDSSAVSRPVPSSQESAR